MIVVMILFLASAGAICFAWIFLLNVVEWLKVKLTGRTRRWCIPIDPSHSYAAIFVFARLLFTGLFLFIVLPLFSVHLLLAKTLAVTTFVIGLLPVIGNLISNTLIFVVALSISLWVAVAALAFLIDAGSLRRSHARGDGDRGGCFGLDVVPTAQSTDAHSPRAICDFLRHFRSGNRHSAG
jgi:hypothetical protein